MIKTSKVPPMVSVSLRYGVAAGVLGFALLMILYYTDHHPFLIPVFLDYRIALFIILFTFALKELRDYFNQGILHFWQGMLVSLLITVIFGTITSISIYVFAINKPEFVQSYINLSMEQVKAFSEYDIDRIGREVYEQGIKSLNSADAYFLSSRYFWQSLIISFFLSIIISVILRRQPKL